MLSIAGFMIGKTAPRKAGPSSAKATGETISVAMPPITPAALNRRQNGDSTTTVRFALAAMDVAGMTSTATFRPRRMSDS